MILPPEILVGLMAWAFKGTNLQFKSPASKPLAFFYWDLSARVCCGFKLAS